MPIHGNPESRGTLFIKFEIEFPDVHFLEKKEDYEVSFLLLVFLMLNILVSHFSDLIGQLITFLSFEFLGCVVLFIIHIIRVAIIDSCLLFSVVEKNTWWGRMA